MEIKQTIPHIILDGVITHKTSVSEKGGIYHIIVDCSGSNIQTEAFMFTGNPSKPLRKPLRPGTHSRIQRNTA
jgi:hypothetical protein